jgi:hypothetical protein
VENRSANIVAPQSQYMNQGLIGAQVMVLPFVEVRPKYLIQENDLYQSTRLAMQLHIFLIVNYSLILRIPLLVYASAIKMLLLS